MKSFKNIKKLWCYKSLPYLCINNTFIMKQASVFNQTQQYLLKMFSYADTDEDLNEIKTVLANYYARKVEREMDSLWDDGLWSEEKNDAILHEHLRTPYK